MGWLLLLHWEPSQQPMNVEWDLQRLRHVAPRLSCFSLAIREAVTDSLPSGGRLHPRRVRGYRSRWALCEASCSLLASRTAFTRYLDGPRTTAATSMRSSPHPTESGSHPRALPSSRTASGDAEVLSGGQGDSGARRIGELRTALVATLFGASTSGARQMRIHLGDGPDSLLRPFPILP